MIKFLFVISLLLLTLQARENPFFPAKGENDIATTSNQTSLAKPLKSTSLTLPSSARLIKKVTIEYMNLDASISKKTIELDNSIDWHLPIFISQNYSQTKRTTRYKKTKNLKFKKIASIKYATFFSLYKTLKVKTSDKIIRNFLLTNPHRIVMDFKRDARLRSYTKENSNSIFTKVRVGNHSGYYRAVVELDGYYRYKMTKTSDGYSFTLR